MAERRYVAHRPIYGFGVQPSERNHTFRLAVALSILKELNRLEGSSLADVGYGAAGTTTVIPSTPTSEKVRDYHFGVTPQALLALRLIAGSRLSFDAKGDPIECGSDLYRGDRFRFVTEVASLEL